MLQKRKTGAVRKLPVARGGSESDDESEEEGGWVVSGRLPDSGSTRRGSRKEVNYDERDGNKRKSGVGGETSEKRLKTSVGAPSSSVTDAGKCLICRQRTSDVPTVQVRSGV